MKAGRRRFLRSDPESALSWAGVGGDHDAVGNARAWRLLVVEVGHGQPPRIRLELLFCIKADPDADGNEHPERPWTRAPSSTHCSLVFESAMPDTAERTARQSGTTGVVCAL